MNSKGKHDPIFKQKVIISIAALLVFGARLAFPSLTIDGVSLGILVVALLPWLSSLIKSAEIPGVGKIEFKDVLAAAEKVTTDEPDITAGAIPSTEFSFLDIADQNPSLALVGLRIEIERRLRSLAQKADIPKSRSLTQLTRDLEDRGVLKSKSVGGLLDLISLGNQAAHGVEVDSEVANSAVEYGPRVLGILDAKLRM